MKATRSRPLLALSCLTWLAGASVTPVAAQPSLDEGWSHPPNEAKLRAYWWWLNSNVDREAITRDLEEMAARGFGGAIIFDAGGAEQRDNDPVPPGPAFASPEWREFFLHAVGEADRLGLELSLNIQSGWNLGGPTVVPEDSVKRVVWSEALVEGAGPARVRLPRPEGDPAYYRDLFVLAFPLEVPDGEDPARLVEWRAKSLHDALRFSGPNTWFLTNSAPDTKALIAHGPEEPGEPAVQLDQVLDLTDRMASDGTLEWDAPAGQWRVLRLASTLAEHSRVSTHSDGWSGYAIDALDPGPFDRYWQAVVKPLLDAAGELTGKSLRYLHTDSWEIEYFNWTPTLIEEFRARRGYDPVPYLPALTGRIVESRDISTRFLNDYRKTLGDLAIDNHYTLFKQYAAEYGMGIHPESGGPHFTPIDAQRALGFNDVPMSEFWADSDQHRVLDISRFFVKQPASAAHTYGRRYVAAEGFTTIGPHWQETLWDNLKPSFDLACTEGLNRLVWHAFVCSPASMGVPGQQYFAGTHLNPLVTWWSRSEPFFDYINRSQWMLMQGRFVADVLYYYGDHVPNYTQLRASDPTGLGAGYDYDVVTEEALLSRVSVEDGWLVLPDGTRYRLLALPPYETISLPVLRKIDELVRAGATLVGPRPLRSSSLTGYPAADAQVAELTEALWGGETGSGRLLPGLTAREALEADGVGPDFEASGASAAADLHYIHRRTGADEADIYFVANRSAQPETIEATFRVSGKAPELWDPVSGKTRVATAYREANGRTTLPLPLDPYGSVFVVFRESAASHPATGAPNAPRYDPHTPIAGPWTVSFDPAWGGPVEAEFPELISWTDRPEDGIRHYSGTATYRTTFTLPGSLHGRTLALDLGEVREIAEVRLNGRNLGVLWSPPFRVDLGDALEQGDNALEIDVVNFWPNRVIGDAGLPEDQRRTRTNVRTLKPDTPLMPAGLMGPVRLVEVVEPASASTSGSAAVRSNVVSYNVTDLTAESFARPPLEDRPWVRWNISTGSDPAELQAELEEMAHSGIAGAEIGQGGFPDTDQLAAVLTRANELGLSISLSHGPVDSPPGFSIDDDNARKTLVVARTTLGAGETFDGAAPAPPPPGEKDAWKRTTLVAVSAYRCSGPACPDSGVVDLVRSSVVDLTTSVTAANTEGVLGGSTAGHLTWTAPEDPAGAQWQVVASWARGAEAQPDLLSLEGTTVFTRGMEAVFADVAHLMRTNRGDFFFDSHSRDRGSPTDSWTNDMRQQFQEKRGYALVPNLPALFPDVFSFDDGSADRVRNDFYQARTDIWLENHVKPLHEWAHRTYGWQIRLQPYGENTPTVDEIQAASVIDRPETESLWFGSAFDHYLPIASANHMTGNPWFSIECCPASNLSYAQSYEDTLIRVHKSFVGGVTKLVYHVYPSTYSETSPWPGLYLFGQRFSNAWGPRNPYWADAGAYNDYFARNQQVLTQGRARVDVAVYMHSYLYPWVNRTEDQLYWVDPGLDRAGYTRDYLNPSLLRLPDASVKDGRLAPNGPAYQAFIIDSSQWPSTDPKRTSMPVEVAERVLSFARAGLPVVVVGTPPDRTPGNTPAADAEVQAVIAELLAQESVHRAASQADVPRLLRSLGVRPSAEPNEAGGLLSVRRSAPDADYYFLYNEVTPRKVGARASLGGPLEGEPLDIEVSLEGRGRPYSLDAWTGEITPIARYRVENGRVRVRVQLAPEEATIIALTTNRQRFEARVPGLHATSLDHDVVYGSDGTILLRAISNGPHSVTLGDGRTVTVTAQGVGEPIDLSDAGWRLVVEDWQPAHPYATTTGIEATETDKVEHQHELTSLEAWPSIPGLADASGIGVYTTTLTLPGDWASSSGASLSLGEVFDSFVVSVNGRPVVFDQLSTTADVGGLLKPGENTISVRVATTLRNRLRTLEEAQEARPRQPYGLVGPVVLQPYRAIEIR